MSTFFPAVMFSRDPEPRRLSRDPRVVEAFINDPLVSSSVSARWFTGLMQAQHDTRARAHELEVPTLLMQSGADTLVDPDATRDWAAAAPSALVDYIEWDGFYHEMFNELEKERVFAAMLAWIGTQLGLQSSPRSTSAP
jgi:lysophospholipase